MTLYTFLDPIIFLAYRVPHLSHDMLPQLADYDQTRNLVHRSFKAAPGFFFRESQETHLLGFYGGLSNRHRH
ncbi:hypothetical protein EI94DRAFT_1756220 [Lactarius quietus]|nr:hypothetical protein EI94DRAFT_1756220 [Lactarius quietus]